jgi:hypothetical protein
MTGGTYHRVGLVQSEGADGVVLEDQWAKTVRPSVQWLLDSMTTAAALVRNGRMDILAVNPGRALYSPVFDHAGRQEPANIARFQFLDPAARDFHPNWAADADTTVAIMRTEAGPDPHNRRLTEPGGGSWPPAARESDLIPRTPALKR